MTAGRLAGLGVLVSRPAGQADRTAAALREAGATVTLFPALALEPIDDAALDAALQTLPGMAMVIFVSANAVEFGIRAVRRRGISLANIRLAAIGMATQAALAMEGLSALIVPATGFDSEALLAHPDLQQVSGQPVMVFRGQSEAGGRQLLSQTLMARGARLVIAECYRRSKPVPAPDAIEHVASLLDAGRIQVLQVMSTETLDNLLSLLGPAHSAALRCVVVVPHERVAAHARARGCHNVLVTGLGDTDLIDTLEQYQAKRA